MDNAFSPIKWINKNDKEPPKNKPFLAATEEGAVIAVWTDNSYVGVCSCNCCPQGGCTIVYFDFWMPLPEKPKGNKSE